MIYIVEIVTPEKNLTKGKHMGKINGLINIVDLFNLIRLLNYEIWNNYYLSDLSYCCIYNNYLSDVSYCFIYFKF